MSQSGKKKQSDFLNCATRHLSPTHNKTKPTRAPSIDSIFNKQDLRSTFLQWPARPAWQQLGVGQFYVSCVRYKSCVPRSCFYYMRESRPPSWLSRFCTATPNTQEHLQAMLQDGVVTTRRGGGAWCSLQFPAGSCLVGLQMQTTYLLCKPLINFINFRL